MRLARWLVYLTIGRLFDLLVVTIIGFYLPYFWTKVRKKGPWAEEPTNIPPPKHTLDSLIQQGAQDPTRDYYFINHTDAHNALLQVGLWKLRPELAEAGLERLITPEGSLYRRYPNDETHLSPSGDCLAAWLFAYKYCNIKRPDLLRKVAWHYLLNCFVLSWYGKFDARSSNGGFNLINGGWPCGKSWWKFKIGFSQPNTGPQALGTAALLAVAASELGWFWHLLYAIHYKIGMVWFWKKNPVQYLPSKERQWYYTHHIAQLNLWLLDVTKGGFKESLKQVAQDMTPWPNPWIAGLAHNRGALDSEYAQKAVRALQSLDTAWPQVYINNKSFTKDDSFDKIYSMLALAAILLKD